MIEIVKLLICIAGAIVLYVIIVLFSVPTVSNAIRMVGQALKWEIQTTVGRINLASIVLAFCLILALPVQGFILDVLKAPQDEPEARMANETVIVILYICFCLFTLGSLLIVTRFEEHRRQTQA